MLREMVEDSLERCQWHDDALRRCPFAERLLRQTSWALLEMLPVFVSPSTLSRHVLCHSLGLTSPLDFAIQLTTQLSMSLAAQHVQPDGDRSMDTETAAVSADCVHDVIATAVLLRGFRLLATVDERRAEVLAALHADCRALVSLCEGVCARAGGAADYRVIHAYLLTQWMIGQSAEALKVQTYISFCLI